MAKKEVLKVEHVGMKFNLSQEKVDDLKDYVIKLLKHQISYNEFWALKDINFTLNKGDRLGILGLNGAGKSTLMNVLYGLYQPTSGQIFVGGKEEVIHSPSRAIELGIGMVHQHLTNSIQDVRIFIFMEQFLDSQRSS